MIIEVEGMGDVTVPDDWSDEQIDAYIEGEFERADPTRKMSQGDRFVAGYGKVYNDLKMSAKDLLGMADEGEVEEARRLDAPLMNTTAGMGGNIAGHMMNMAAAPVTTVPKAAMVAGSYAAAQPGDMVERAVNTVLGTTGGAAGQKAGQYLASGIPKYVDDATKLVQDAARKLGVKMTPGTITGNASTLAKEASMASNPATAGKVSKIKDHNVKLGNRTAARAMGEPETDKITNEVLDAAETNIGARMEQVRGVKDIEIPNVVERVRRVADNYRKVPGAPNKAVVTRIVDDLDEASGTVTGADVMVWRRGWANASNSLKKQLGGDTELAKIYDEAVYALDDAVVASAPAGTKQAYDAARRQWQNKILIDKATKHGDVSMAKLSTGFSRVKIRQQSKKRGGLDKDTQDLYDLARFGEYHPQIGDSGTASRQALAKSYGQLALGGGAGIGASLATGDPSYAALGVAAGVAPNLMMRAKAGATMNPASNWLHRAPGPLSKLPGKDALPDLLRMAGGATAPKVPEIMH